MFRSLCGHHQAFLSSKFCVHCWDPLLCLLCIPILCKHSWDPGNLRSILTTCSKRLDDDHIRVETCSLLYKKLCVLTYWILLSLYFNYRAWGLWSSNKELKLGRLLVEDIPLCLEYINEIK